VPGGGSAAAAAAEGEGEGEVVVSVKSRWGESSGMMNCKGWVSGWM